LIVWAIPFSAGKNRAVVNTHEHEILQCRLALGPEQHELDQRIFEPQWGAFFTEVVFEADVVRFQEPEPGSLARMPFLKLSRWRKHEPEWSSLTALEQPLV
jgi:hypothetical protein